jgi:hypothetical protein
MQVKRNPAEDVSLAWSIYRGEAAMGGSGGGGFSSSEMSKLQQAAEERLRAIISQSSKVLFACEESGRKSLDSHLARSKVFTSARILVVDSDQTNEAATKLLEGASFLVVFTNRAKATKFLDTLIDQALVQSKTGIHVRVDPAAIIPSKVTAYRWRSINWEELEALFT